MSPRARPDARGVALCIASVVGFGAMAIFAKEAYAGGANVWTLLAVRFTLAAAALWALVLWRLRTHGVPAVRRLWLRDAAPGLALGALYAVEASAFFVALDRIDAALAELLLYIYPAIVVGAAALFGREALTAARVQVLVLTTAGLVLVLAAGGISTLDGLGVAAALTSACLYAGYVLVSDRVVAGRDAVIVSAQITTSAAALFVAYGLASASIDLGLSGRAWVATLALTALSTVVPILAFLAGMKRVGVGTASLLSTAEPVITVALAMLVLQERLAPLQLAGGALVVGALVVLARAATSPAGPAVADPTLGYARADEPAPRPAGPPSAREVREHPALR
jgi:drug/metabolite transporter (DMT)-like permease